MDSPLKPGTTRVGRRRSSDDHTVVFTPDGKESMLVGGIGCIRLKPISIGDEPHWLMTATSDGVVHTGVPIAVPMNIYAQLVPELQKAGAAWAVVRGELKFVDNTFVRLFDRSVQVPKLYLRVTDLQPCEPMSTAHFLEASVAVSFLSKFEGRPKVYTTYVTFEPNVPGSFDDALTWMKEEYVEGEYKGRIITDFDQTQTIFEDARLALSSVMDRLISRGVLQETIELMHATASVDEYFEEIDKRKLLFETQKTRRSKIFISYAHETEEWVDRIRTHLTPLGYDSGLEVWDDTKIQPGDRWKDEIDDALRQTKVAILVLTADFLASKFIQESELPLLLEAAEAQGAKILCVYGSEVHLSGLAARLENYQFVNSKSKPLLKLAASGRERVYAKLAATVEKLMKGS
jgi:TIR domain-containing protein